MQINKDQQREDALRDFFKYVESEILIYNEDSEIIQNLKLKIKEGYDLVANKAWIKAFENVSEDLCEHYFILNRTGIQKVKKIIELCGIADRWQYDLRRIKSLGYVSGSWYLVDSEKRAKANKYTFYKPTRMITDQLTVGDLVKMTFEFESTNDDHPGGERMWVQITEIKNGKFKGILDNHPFYLHELYADDEISFEHKHIIDHQLDISEPNLVDKYFDRCFITSKVLYENQSVNYLYREEPMESDDERDYEDSGWRIMAGDESDEYMDDSAHIHLVSLGAVLNCDDSFIHLLEAPIGSCYERNEDGVFVIVE